MIRSLTLFGMVGAVLLVIGACADPDLDAPDDGVVLPERGNSPDASDDVARPADADVDRPDVPDAATDAADAAPPALRVFVSSSMSKANFGGLIGADTVCANLAIAAGLGGTWVAWLSKEGTPNAVGRVTSLGPWRLVSGEMVAATKAELISGTLRHAIDHDEKGVAVAASRAWTGTGPDGQYLTNDCDKWTTGSNGRVGSTAALDPSWTSASIDDCGNDRHVYCFQR